MLEKMKDYLHKRLQVELPGTKSHIKMISYRRKSAEKALKQKNGAKLSAVLILLYPYENEIYTVLIQRPKYKGVHSAQISLPGGKKEKNDEDLEYTALRETEEEIGITKQNIQTIGSLTSIYIPPSNYVVKPFVGYVDKEPSFKLDPNEVDNIITTPLSILLNTENIKTTKVKVMNGFISLKVPCFDVYGNIVWGATAMILSEFCDIIKEQNNFNKL